MPVEGRGVPMTSTRPCVAHRFHRPAPHHTELHHVIPQAWQRLWFPDSHVAGYQPSHQHDPGSPIAHGVKLPKAGLWAPDTVPLCPTGHANVHALIVEMMHVLLDERSDDPLAGWLAIKQRNREAKIAYQALTGFRSKGGSLLLLAQRGQYGQA